MSQGPQPSGHGGVTRGRFVAPDGHEQYECTVGNGAAMIADRRLTLILLFHLYYSACFTNLLRCSYFSPASARRDWAEQHCPGTAHLTALPCNSARAPPRVRVGLQAAAREGQRVALTGSANVAPRTADASLKRHVARQRVNRAVVSLHTRDPSST